MKLPEHDTRRDAEAAVILVFRIGSLGDTVVALPALHMLRRRFPKAHITLLTNSPVDGGLKAASAVQILQGSGLVDSYIEYPHGQRSATKLLGVIRRVRKLAPSLGVYLMPPRTRGQTMRDRVFFRTCGVRRMVGLGLARLDYRPPVGPNWLWESESNRLLRCVGLDRASLTPADFSLHLTEDEHRFGEEALRRAGICKSFIAISVGTKIPVNDWGEQRWSAFLELVSKGVSPIDLVLIGSAGESRRSERIARQWPWKTANLCGDLAPRQSAAVLRLARLFVGHDSGPMHLAAAVGTTTVAIFSGRELPGVWFPLAQEQNMFYPTVPCDGCRVDECLLRRTPCITTIEPRDVARRVLAHLAAAPLSVAAT